MLPDYETLEQRVVEFGARYPEEVPRPAYWGGYLLRPERSSSGRAAPTGCTTASCHVRDGDGWRSERLAP